MTNNEIKNQVTLFRFVGLRAPELAREENLPEKFVLHPAHNDGHFAQALAADGGARPKDVVLKEAALAYAGIKSLGDLKTNFSLHFEKARWLSQNPNGRESDKIEILNNLSPLDAAPLIELWDAFYYQMITKEDFYLKEAIAETLIFNNALSLSKKETTDERKLEAYNKAASATLVLPTEVFGNNVLALQTNRTKPIEVEPEAAFFDTVQRMGAKTKAHQLRQVAQELNKLSLAEEQSLQKSRAIAYENYQAAIKPLIDQYAIAYNAAQDEICTKINNGSIQPNSPCAKVTVPFPTLPKFNFDTEVVHEASDLLKLLPIPLQARFAELFPNSDEKLTIAQSILMAEKAVEANVELATPKLEVAEKYAMLGGVLMPLQKGTSFAQRVASLPFQLCTAVNAANNVDMYMVVQVPDATYTVAQNNFLYTSSKDGDNNNTNGFFVGSTNSGNALLLDKMYNNALPYALAQAYTSIKGTIKFSNGEKFSFSLDGFPLNGCLRGTLINDNAGEEGPEDLPAAYGFRQLGIADYKKVVAHVCCYDAGEVAHIENVMARELRSKTTTKERVQEVTTTSETIHETEQLSDTVSAQRFEMQTEIARLLQEQKQFSANAHVESDSWKIKFSADAGYASNTSKQESNRQAVAQAKEITERAMERIVSRTRKETVVKTTDRFAETNDHTFDNTSSDKHVSGVYRFINAIYKNQVYNYGKRLMYEFMVPEPAMFHQLALQVPSANVAVIEKPVSLEDLGITKPEDLNQDNYQAIASAYKVKLAPYPMFAKTISKTFANSQANQTELMNENVDLEIPDGYCATRAKININAQSDLESDEKHAFLLGVGDYKFSSFMSFTNIVGVSEIFNLPNIEHKLPVSFSMINYLVYQVGLTIDLQTTDEHLNKWKTDAYATLQEAYSTQLIAYEDAVASAKTNEQAKAAENPLYYREYEQQALRLNCIAYMLNTQSNPAYRLGNGFYNYVNIPLLPATCPT